MRSPVRRPSCDSCSARSDATSSCRWSSTASAASISCVDGWLVVECDSKEFHEGWEQQVKDRNRDLALAARGYVTLRLTAAQIMYRAEEVLAAVKGLLATR